MYNKAAVIYITIYTNSILTDGAENGDTISRSDVVTMQYENLPYPPINEERLLNEEKCTKNFLNINQYKLI